MTLLDLLLTQLLTLISANPTLLKIVVLMGTLRLILKPIMVAIDSIVVATPSTSDNALWEKVKASGPYKILALVLDYVGSIKLPEAK